MRYVILAAILVIIALMSGCGPSYREQREQALSDMNTVIYTWDSSDEDLDLHGRKDPWGTPYKATIRHQGVKIALEMRSAGPDKLFNNSDDIVVKSERNLRGKTLSDMNNLADGWIGKETLPDLRNMKDPWGNPYIASVSKGDIHFILTIRSAGPDGLPQNDDDITILRYKRHGEYSMNEEVEKGAASISRGLFKGAKEGLSKDPKEKK